MNNDLEATAAGGRSGMGVGLVIVLLGALTFASVIVMLPTGVPRTIVALLAPSVTMLAILVWWLATRSATWRTKAIGFVLVAAVALILWIVSVAPVTMFAFLWGVPGSVALMLVVHALARGRGAASRRLGVGAALVVSIVPWGLLRADGATGQLMPNFAWVWRFVPESVEVVPIVGNSPALLQPVVVTEFDWPGFRGAHRDGVVPGPLAAGLRLDWRAQPPVERWRQPIGRGWSSFAIVGDLVYTQEQSGEREHVVCLDGRTGERQWVHVDDARFEEFAAGVGPRATPLVHDGLVYTLGAMGRLNCLDARTGERRWSADVSSGRGAAPQWGYASSPLIHEGLVYVSPGGVGGVRMMAFDATTGDRRWQASGADPGYSSAHLGRLGGKEQIMLFDGGGLVSYEPASGTVLWDHSWPTQTPKVNQPHVVDEQTVIVGMGYGKGLKSLAVTRDDDAWTVAERWSSRRLKPKFNDFILHEGYAYGLDEGILACVDVAGGKRQWKGERYGYGQMLLVEDTLLIVTESGELVLVDATPEGAQETARIEVLSGKTWNHPAAANGHLFVRNGNEAVCFDLRGPAPEPVAP